LKQNGLSRRKLQIFHSQKPPVTPPKCPTPIRLFFLNRWQPMPGES
jgi:hypothetical protein